MKTTRTKIICFIVCVLFVAVVSAVSYEYILIEKMEDETVSLQGELKSEKQSLESFTALSKTASNIKADSEKANSFFIKRDEVVTFLDRVEEVASSTGASVSVKSVDEKKSQANQSLLAVSVQIDGSYSQVFYTLRMLEELPFQTEVRNVKLSNVSASGQKKITAWSAEVGLVGVMF